jgi:hypothetical protein
MLEATMGSGLPKESSIETVQLHVLRVTSQNGASYTPLHARCVLQVKARNSVTADETPAAQQVQGHPLCSVLATVRSSGQLQLLC